MRLLSAMVRRSPAWPPAIALVLLASTVGGCSSRSPAAPVAAQEATPALESTRGLLVDVQSASITMLRAVEVRTEDGRTLRFTVEGDTGLTPGHAREHMVGAEPVTVSYRATPDGLVAVRIDD